MSKSLRLFDLMQLLRRHRQPIAGSELARHAGVSLRTIRRDVASLQALGAAIEGEPGIGYVLKPGFMLPPLMFSAEELHALTLGAQLVVQQTDESLSLAANNALAKIGAVLPAELRDHLHDNGFYVSAPPSSPLPFDLTPLRLALREQRKILLSYRDATGVQSKRTIWPISLGFVENQRFIAGWCELRQDFRIFRIDRIESVEVQAECYPGSRRALLKQWRPPGSGSGGVKSDIRTRPDH